MRALKPVLAAAVALAVVGCAANPIIARDPIPPPDPALAYTCASRDVAFGQFYNTTCRVTPRPVTVIVRAKG